MIDRRSLRLPATLLLVGQLLFIVITLFHTDGAANDHPAVFARYAASTTWKAVHLGQFAAMAILLAGLFVFPFAIGAETGIAQWTSRLGAAASVAALALYGALQAVDGVANKQAVDAWVSAPAAEKAARFASAETVRWLEWGMRSYQTYTLGLAVILLGTAVFRTAGIPRAIGYLMLASGLTYLAQGGVVGAGGFTQMETATIELAYVLDVIWMTWLASVAWRSTSTPALGG